MRKGVQRAGLGSLPSPPQLEAALEFVPSDIALGYIRKPYEAATVLRGVRWRAT